MSKKYNIHLFSCIHTNGAPREKNNTYAKSLSHKGNRPKEKPPKVICSGIPQQPVHHAVHNLVYVKDSCSKTC